MAVIRVCHLYPDQLNIYADRGNIAVFRSRALARGHELEVIGVGAGEPLDSDCDLIYLGGGQDCEQQLIAPDLAARRDEILAALKGGAALLAVCGGYQLLGRGYRDRSGAEMPGAGVLPLETVAGDGRMIGDVAIECELDPGETHSVVGFENHGGRTKLDERAVPLGRVVHGFGNDGESGYEGCRLGNAIGTYLHGPLLPRNPWLADWILSRALERRLGEPVDLEPLEDDLEHEAHAVALKRARHRGGKFR
jgi:CobQ-like glutamine amidotransferase family enzyme